MGGVTAVYYDLRLLDRLVGKVALASIFWIRLAEKYRTLVFSIDLDRSWLSYGYDKCRY